MTLPRRGSSRSKGKKLASTKKQRFVDGDLKTFGFLDKPGAYSIGSSYDGDPDSLHTVNNVKAWHPLQFDAYLEDINFFPAAKRFEANPEEQLEQKQAMENFHRIIRENPAECKYGYYLVKVYLEGYTIAELAHAEFPGEKPGPKACVIKKRMHTALEFIQKKMQRTTLEKLSKPTPTGENHEIRRKRGSRSLPRPRPASQLRQKATTLQKRGQADGLTVRKHLTPGATEVVQNDSQNH